MDKRYTHLPPQRQNKFGSSITGATAINAVAFQDHWARQLCLNTKTFGPQQVGLGPAAKAAKKKQIKAVVDTGLNKPRPKAPPPKEKEYVLDEKPPPLTLAQKLGLVEAPQQLLSETEWSTLKAKSNARDDSKEPCVICKEDFGLQEQVLLSCSHVFHRACLHAFERYTGRKTCPMCRREQYQTRIIHEGAKMHREICATKIQAAWRGYVVRCWYRKLRDTVPPNDPKLRKKFYLEKFEAITDRIIKSCDFDVNTFLTEIDVSLEQSRNIFRQFDTVHRIISEEEWERIQLKAVERSHQECPICLTNLCTESQDSSPEKSDAETRTSKQNKSATPNSFKRGPPTKGGDKVEGKGDKLEVYSVKGRKSKEDNAGEIGAGEGRKRGKKEPRRTVLLSCTHVFHQTCLQTLEQLAMGEVRNTCPVCRTPYQKRVVAF